MAGAPRLLGIYGPHHDEMVAVVDRERLPKQIEPTAGQHLSVQRKDTIDGNHQLAGKHLLFGLELVGVKASRSGGAPELL
jgi:FKBP-type peptidyl-prolyl cis-trans isomerase 2